MLSTKIIENIRKNKSENFLKMDILKMSKNENLRQRISKKMGCYHNAVIYKIHFSESLHKKFLKNVHLRLFC